MKQKNPAGTAHTCCPLWDFLFLVFHIQTQKIDKAYRDRAWWTKAAMLNVACSGKFTSDRTIQEYVDDIWHLDKITVEVQ